MIIQRAFTALWQGIVSPEEVPKAGSETALALFALAVFLLAGISTISAYVEDGSPTLKAETEVLSQYGMAPPAPEGEQVEVVTTPGQVFISVFGGALMMSLGKIGVLAGVMMVLGRFMTNAQTSYKIALASVSSTALIDVLKGAVTIPLHLTTDTVRAGFSRGRVRKPNGSPLPVHLPAADRRVFDLAVYRHWDGDGGVEWTPQEVRNSRRNHGFRGREPVFCGDHPSFLVYQPIRVTYL